MDLFNNGWSWMDADKDALRDGDHPWGKCKAMFDEEE